MKKTTRLIAAITVLLLISGIIVFQAKVLDDSKAMSARLGRENAKMTERWIINATQSKLDASYPGLKRGVNGSGGEYRSQSNKFEILTANDIYWWESVDPVELERIATEIESLPDVETWIHAGFDADQQRRVELRVVGTGDRPILRILFLCSNLPEGETTGEGFLKNMWPQNKET